MGLQILGKLAIYHRFDTQNLLGDLHISDPSVFFRGLKQGKKGSKRVLVFMFQNINYAKNDKQELKNN